VGYSWEESPIRYRYEGYTVPANDRQTYTVGVGFYNENWSVDVAYLYLQCKQRRYHDIPVQTGGTGTIASSGTVNANEIAFSIGYTFYKYYN
jgi:long-chain fatty acid transport protein